MWGDDERGACAAVKWPRTTLPREPSVRLHLPRWGACAFTSGPPRPQSRDPPPGRLQEKRSSGTCARVHTTPLSSPAAAAAAMIGEWARQGAGRARMRLRPSLPAPLFPAPSPPRPLILSLLLSLLRPWGVAGAGPAPFASSRSLPVSRRARAELGLPSACARWLNRVRTVPGPRGPKCSGRSLTCFTPVGEGLKSLARPCDWGHF